MNTKQHGAVVGVRVVLGLLALHNASRPLSSVQVLLLYPPPLQPLLALRCLPVSQGHGVTTRCLAAPGCAIPPPPGGQQREAPLPVVGLPLLRFD